MNEIENVVVIGAGCAGWTAAIYAARANLRPIVVTGALPGGQLSTTTAVENYPGFPDGIMGPDLMELMKKQAEKFGARSVYGEVTDVALDHHPFTVVLDEEKNIRTKTIIVASGASPRYLGLPNEKKLIGHGVTSCATCDGAFYPNVPVAVIGGGDSACGEATFLTRFASEVYLIHRRDELRASKIMAARSLDNPKIKPIWDSVVTAYLEDEAGNVRGVRLKNAKTNTESELVVKAVFVAIGYEPNTQIFRGKLDLDEKGYLKVTHGTTTNVPGVFVAGDVHDHVYRQAVTAAGMGCTAAIDAERYLATLDA